MLSSDSLRTNCSCLGSLSSNDEDGKLEEGHALADKAGDESGVTLLAGLTSGLPGCFLPCLAFLVPALPSTGSAGEEFSWTVEVSLVSKVGEGLFLVNSADVGCCGGLSNAVADTVLSLSTLIPV